MCLLPICPKNMLFVCNQCCECLSLSGALRRVSMFFFETAGARQEESQSSVKNAGKCSLLGDRARVRLLATRHFAGLKIEDSRHLIVQLVLALTCMAGMYCYTHGTDMRKFVCSCSLAPSRLMQTSRASSSLNRIAPLDCTKKSSFCP